MKHWSVGLIVSPLVMMMAACGSPSSSSGAIPPSVTRHHGDVAVTMKWTTSAVELKPLGTELVITPRENAVKPLGGTLKMRDMSMVPLPMRWTPTAPGRFRSSAVPTMAGPWVLTVTLGSGSTRWRESFPVAVQN